MAQSELSYIDELQNELKETDPNSHANRLIQQEIDRLTKGEEDKDRKDRTCPVLEIHNEKQNKCSLKVRIPIKEYPRYNFVGKLLGPRGTTLKAIQDQTGCKMAIMGKGSMREKDKEEEYRKQGGKYAHLNEDLHVLVECFTDYTDGYHRLAAGLTELKKFMIPELTEEMYAGGDGMGGDMGMNGAPPGRGGFRGGPPERGRGAFRGRGNGHAPPPPAAARGAPAGRGGPPPRGGPRGGPVAGRGGPVARGGPAARGGPGGPPARGGRAPVPPPSYDAYGTQQNYSAANYGGSYDNSYSENYGQDSSYYDYGQSASAGGGYDAYSAGYGDYSEAWGAGGAGGAGGSGVGKAPSAPARGTARPTRAHPYSRPGAAAGGY